jgi:hypothetical protein
MNTNCVIEYECEIKPKLGYLENNIIYPHNMHYNTVSVNKKYYYKLFMTDYEQYYICIDYEITETILEAYKNYIRYNVSLPQDIIELISFNLFGYYNLDFLNKYDRKYHIIMLLKQYILDAKCLFAYIPHFYIDNIRIVLNNKTLTNIYKHYSSEENKFGMSYWITTDYLEISDY